MSTPYSVLLRGAQLAAGSCALEVPDDWLQGRSVFGGLQAAVMLRAMRTQVPDTPLRTLQVSFVAPVPGGCVQAEARVLRSGKSATQVEARIMDGGQVLATAVGIFGGARASVIRQLPVQPAVEAPAPVEFRFVPGITPSFTQHFASRWLKGALPFTGTPTPELVVEIGMRDEGMASEAHALAIADLIPPLALSWLKTPAPGSSMTWMLEFFSEGLDALPLTGWRVDAELVAATGGYTSQSVMVWGPGGVPVAISRQSMVVFG